MKINKYFSVMLMAVALAAVVGCASTSTKEGTGEFIDDSVITTKVKTAILNEPGLKVADIKVETFKGTVQLDGFVNSSTDEKQAVEVTRRVGGVKAVRNNLHIR